ncbi:hypothetical protein [Metapseudomonas boanensis]|uniref:Lipoprotein n=1 Tax=Metapseudomonas boanensis TaxID=2822138 RepID=A0ABS5XDG2_9GAMM|nr:hypothetical protein [Pseudomonas boanensis]MBT8765231.1 hypothetical protein [Pseudomonas boanensis]
MKKTLSLALLLAASLGLAACDKKEEAQAPAAPATETQPSAPAAPEAATPPASEPAPAAPSTAPAAPEEEAQ